MALDYSVASAGNVGANKFIPGIDETDPANPVPFKLSGDPFTTLTLAASMTLDMDTVNKDKPYELIWPNASAIDPTLTFTNTATNKGKFVTFYLINNSGTSKTITFAGTATRLYQYAGSNRTGAALEIQDGERVQVVADCIDSDELLLTITEPYVAE
jgi:hypothetical protein